MLNAVGHAQINSATPAAARGIAFAPAQAQEIERFGRSVIRAETAALESLGDRTDGSFVDACRYLLRCRGRIVVVGTGKSGHIARKIAATLASTGSPAFYVHPAEACHGDLGMIQPQDVVLALSNSGGDHRIGLAVVSERIMARRISDTIDGPADCKSRDRSRISCGLALNAMIPEV